MVVITRLFAAAPIGEKMTSIKIFQKPGRFFVSGERDGLGQRNRRRNRRQHEDALVVRLRAAEDLSGEIVEDRVLAFAERLVERCAAPAEVLAQQHERSDPPLALPLDAFHVLPVEMLASEYRLGFLGRTAELRSVEARDAAPRHEARELRRRIRA